jgi:S1-C subfamily serine protease
MQRIIRLGMISTMLIAAYLAWMEPSTLGLDSLYKQPGAAPVVTPMDVWNEAYRSVARIEVTGTATDQKSHQQVAGSSTGTGFLIDQEGYLVTNCHVVRPPEFSHWQITKIEVQFADSAGYRQIGSVHGCDRRSDLAVIALGRRVATKPLQFGNWQALRVGQQVFAIGYAAG